MHPDCSTIVARSAILFALTALTACGSYPQNAPVNLSQTAVSTEYQSSPMLSAQPPIQARKPDLSKPDWQIAGLTDNFIAYVDKNNIVERGGHRYAWIIHDYLTPKYRGAKIVSSTTLLEGFDCPQGQSSIIASTSYSGRQGSGQVVDSYPKSSNLEWNYLIHR